MKAAEEALEEKQKVIMCFLLGSCLNIMQFSMSFCVGEVGFETTFR